MRRLRIFNGLVVGHMTNAVKPGDVDQVNGVLLLASHCGIFDSERIAHLLLIVEVYNEVGLADFVSHAVAGSSNSQPLEVEPSGIL